MQGYAAWWGVRTIIRYLDGKLPYTNQPLKRIYLQLLLTTISGLLIIIVLTELLNYLVKDTPVPVVFYTYYIFIFLIWFLVINGIYIGLHFYGEWKRAESLRVEEKKVRSKGYVVKVGKQNLSLPFEEITGFYVDGDYTVLVSHGDKRYFLDESLDKIEQSIPSELFFRLNRQFIVNRKAINGFKRVENNKLDILIHPSIYFPEIIQVSRTKAPAFKMWFHP
jgi:hypothetical protein